MRPSRFLVLILVLLVFPVTVWAQQQQTIYACVKTNNGQMRFVGQYDKCLPSERAVSWAASASTTNVPPAAPAAGPLKVVDQAGGTVGFFMPGPYSSLAARQAGDLWLAIPVTADGFLFNRQGDFLAYHVTPDCSGDMYLQVEPANILRTGFLINDGGAKFYYPTKTQVDGAAIQAMGYYLGGNLVCSPWPGGLSPTLVFGKASIMDLGAFSGPFKVVQ